MQTKLSRYCEGLLEAIWLAAVIIIPLFFNIYSSRIFEPDKVAILRSLALFALGAWLVKIIDAGGVHWVILKRNGSWFRTLWYLPMFVPVVGLIVVYLVSTAFSISPQVSLWGSYQRLQGTYTTISYLVIFAVIVANMRNWSQVERLLTTIIITSLPITLYGLLQRFSLDPIPWAGNTITRVAANMGNSIFLAAYIIMVVPITAGRLLIVFRKLLTEETQRTVHIAQASIYTFILVMQFIAIYLSQSRGPVMGLLVGGFVMALILSVTRGKRWISFAVIGMGIVGGGLLIGLNLENGPLSGLRDVPGIGRFGKLLDPESTTALTRKYIWEGAADLVGIHPPIKFPNGETDPYNFLRPLIGYGPETMYVAFNQFYPPELGHYEKRNASPDRSHNETWDALAFTGLSGLVAYLVIFGGIFYYGVKWLGLIRSRRNGALLVFLEVAGGIGGAVGFSVWRGTEYLGIGVPFGLIAGLLLYIMFVGVIRKRGIRHSDFILPDSWVSIMLFSALVAHFIEINFGIAIVATRMLFWIYVGLLIVVGHILPFRNQTGETQINFDAAGSSKADLRSEKRMASGKYKKGNRAKPYSLEQKDSWKRQMYIVGLIFSLIMVTISYDYIINPLGDTTIGSILIRAFTTSARWDFAFSAGILVLCVATLASGVLLFTSENEAIQNKSVWWKAFGGATGTAGGIWVIYSVIYAGKLAALARTKPQNQFDVIAQIGDIGGLLSLFYIFIGLILLGIAYLLIDEMSLRIAAGSSLGVVAAPIFLIIVLGLINITNFQVIKADISFKMAEPFVSTNQWKMATLLYQHALELAPMEDHYYLFLGRSYLEQAKTAQTVTEQNALILQAEADLKIAQSINPLNTDHTANLARLYYWWASRAFDPETSLERGQIANEYFKTAVTLSPNNMAIWGEWAILNFQILQQTQKAFDLLAHAIEIDSKYCFTQGLMGDFYTTIADATEDRSEKTAALEQAVNYYSEAVLVHTRRDTTPKSTYLISLGKTYMELAGQSDQNTSNAYNQLAVRAFEESIQSDLPSEDIWKVQETLAHIFTTIGDNHSALEYAQLALAGAPDDARERLTSFIESIKEIP
jgi:tetratricopeptide (TPR) repeat protein